MNKSWLSPGTKLYWTSLVATKGVERFGSALRWASSSDAKQRERPWWPSEAEREGTPGAHSSGLEAIKAWKCHLLPILSFSERFTYFLGSFSSSCIGWCKRSGGWQPRTTAPSASVVIVPGLSGTESFTSTSFASSPQQVEQLPRT